MKNARKWICMMLAVLVVLTVLPVQAAAADSGKVKIIYLYNKKQVKTETIEVGDEPVTLEPEQYLHVGKNTYSLKGFSNNKKTMTIPAFKDTDDWHDKYDTIKITYEAHTHKYYFTFDRMNHKQYCACGRDFDVEPHISPLSAPDKTCTCGYKFSDNTALTTLWFTNVRFTDTVQSGATEFNGTTVTYYDVTETKITAATFDGKATIELPEDTTIQEGPNTFQITVTAEDLTTKTTYTFNVIKPVKVEGVPVSYDGKTVTAQPKTKTVHFRTAITTLPDAVLAKAAEVAAQEGYEQVVLKPDINQWNNDLVKIDLPGKALEQIANANEVSLLISTIFGDVTIPHAALTELVGAEETLTVSITRGTGAAFYNGETEITTLPEGVAYVQPEA